MVNVHNCDSYINIPSSQTYRLLLFLSLRYFVDNAHGYENLFPFLNAHLFIQILGDKFVR
jgi:hypothetical protein